MIATLLANPMLDVTGPTEPLPLEARSRKVNSGCATTVPHVVAFTTRFRLRLSVADYPPNGPAMAVASGARFAGVGVDAIPTMIGLNLELHVGGRLTPDQRPLRDRLVTAGATVHMTPVRGRGAIEVDLPEGRSVRLFPGPVYSPTHRDVEFLTDTNPAALVLDGGLGTDYTTFMLELAAGRGIPTFLIMTGQDSLPRVDLGGRVYLLFTPPFLPPGDAPSRQVLNLHEESGATATFVQDRHFGLLAVEGRSEEVYQLPLLGVGGERGEDACWGGLIAAFLQTPPEIRIARALQAGRLCATRRIQGRPPVATWRDLNDERRRSPVPSLLSITPDKLISSPARDRMRHRRPM